MSSNKKGPIRKSIKDSITDRLQSLIEWVENKIDAIKTRYSRKKIANKPSTEQPKSIQPSHVVSANTSRHPHSTHSSTHHKLPVSETSLPVKTMRSDNTSHHPHSTHSSTHHKLPVSETSPPVKDDDAELVEDNDDEHYGFTLTENQKKNFDVDSTIMFLNRELEDFRQTLKNQRARKPDPSHKDYKAWKNGVIKTLENIKGTKEKMREAIQELVDNIKGGRKSRRIKKRRNHQSRRFRR